MIEADTRGEMSRRPWRWWRTIGSPPLAVTVVILVMTATACTAPAEPTLKADRLLGSTVEELKARLGKPRIENEETANHFGSMRWQDIDGVDVLVVLKGGTGSYVTYHFLGTEPFDEAAVLELIDVALPNTPPQQIADSTARRWQPCGDFKRLTINPATRLVSVGTNPL